MLKLVYHCFYSHCYCLYYYYNDDDNDNYDDNYEAAIMILMIRILLTTMTKTTLTTTTPVIMIGAYYDFDDFNADYNTDDSYKIKTTMLTTTLVMR